ncbi:MAG: 1-deoxy-D-xylulose-5-phosphate synthase [Alkaliphilus sp.]
MKELKDYLSKIYSPEDIKKLNEFEIAKLSKEIREFLISSVSKTGGHLASNLGVVELTLAIHSEFDSTKDKIIWDVGHQTYVHKIITGRKDKFSTLRQYKGLSGFPKRSESVHDHFDTGHSSTSISAAIGMATARDLKKDKHSVIAVIGDGALTGGMAFEALNHAGHSKNDVLVILNDNAMSISQNVGGLSKYLNRLRSAPLYNRFKKDIDVFLKNIPIVGEFTAKTIEKIKDSIKYFLVPGVLFEEYGFTYIGPVDGHDYSAICQALKQCKTLKGPVLLHVITTKGKGYSFAEKYPDIFHGISPFEIQSGKPVSSSSKTTFSKVAGDTLVQCAKEDEKVVVITAAMPSGTGLNDFQRLFPKRLFDVGIAEQHATTFAAGLAAGGYKAVFPVYSTFLQRGYDQVLHDVCLQNLPVLLLIDRAGLVGDDGETHHGVFDISFLTSIPNLTIMSPKDGVELNKMILYSLKQEFPIAIRYPRGNAEVKSDYTFAEIAKGKGEVVFESGTDAVIFAIGNMTNIALTACKKLKEKGINTTLVNTRFIKPLDKKLITTYAKKCKRIYTIEDNVKIGGFGMQILSLLNDANINKNIKILALPDKFIEHGSVESLFDYYGLNSNKIRDTIASDVNSKDFGNISIVK